MAHLHFWGRFCLKSSQRFRLYDKSRSRLSLRERARAFASLPPDNSFIRLKERFAASRAPPLTWASHFPIVCGLRGSPSKPYGPFGHLTLPCGEKQACWGAVGANQRPAGMIPGAILPQMGLNWARREKLPQIRGELSSEKQRAGPRGKEKGSLARGQRR